MIKKLLTRGTVSALTSIFMMASLGMQQNAHAQRAPTPSAPITAPTQRPAGQQFLPAQFVADLEKISITPGSPMLQPSVANTFALALASGANLPAQQAFRLQSFMQDSNFRQTPLIPSNLILWARYVVEFEAMASGVLLSYDNLHRNGRARYPNIAFPTKDEVRTLRDTASRLRPDICFRVTGDPRNQTCAGLLPQR